ncbi:hypothetical protein [Tautonia rosea]|uniref:hypothetical protein n=1 Tax=Tautonia rosea TaxID=2728037 RepID=UPI001476323A|nr:hypothetical protein [Tautonia rosea]
MMFGPNRILACPSCETRVSVPTWLSGNTFGAVSFTDGSMIAMHMPDVPRFTRCKGCGTLFWIDERHTGGPEPALPDPTCGVLVELTDADDTAEQVEHPTVDDLAEAISLGLASNSDDELNLRVHFWWAGNKPFRSVPKETVPDWPAGGTGGLISFNT